MLKTQQEKAEKERMIQQQKAEAEAKAEAEREEKNAKLLGEQKRKDLERLQAELDAASPAPALVASPAKEKFGFLRKRAATKASPRSSESSSGPSLSQTKSNEPPRRIEQGGGGIVPQTDAPISASNAGERVSVLDLHNPYSHC
jgi:hypothetical protein